MACAHPDPERLAPAVWWCRDCGAVRSAGSRDWRTAKTPQQRLQERRIAAGLCRCCGKTAINATLCAEHREIINAKRRNPKP